MNRRELGLRELELREEYLRRTRTLLFGVEVAYKAMKEELERSQALVMIARQQLKEMEGDEQRSEGALQGQGRKGGKERVVGGRDGGPGGDDRPPLVRQERGDGEVEQDQRAPLPENHRARKHISLGLALPQEERAEEGDGLG